MDMWMHAFCLGCDKQTDGDTYCTESCRLADYEKSPSTPSSQPGSPGLELPCSWEVPTPAVSRLRLDPACDFAAFYRRQAPVAPPSTARTEVSSSGRPLSPSSSHTSLCSMQSSSTASSSSSSAAAARDALQLSDMAMKELLQAYANSFEQVRLQRRRSY